MPIRLKLGVKKCNRFFTQLAASHTQGIGCPYCGFKKITDKKRFTLDVFLTKSINMHGDLYDYSLVKLINVNTKVDIRCKSCELIFSKTPINHYRGQGCPICAMKKRSESQLSNTDEFKEKAEKVHGKLYGLDEIIYTGAKKKIKALCYKHGEFHVTPNNFLSGKGCPICKASKGEIRIFKWLNSKNIEFIREYSLPDTPYRFDFYLPAFNILIEYDGIQHFKPVKRFGGKEGFLKTKKNDVSKNVLSILLSINLIRIPYTELQNLENLLIERLRVNGISL